MIFNGERIVVPQSLRAEMLELIHESHLGMQKCKSRAREVLYWPSMLKDIERTVNKCEICIALRPNQSKEPLLPHQVPERPWQKLAADIMTLDKDDYLVVTDYFSKYPEIARLERKTAGCVIRHLKSIMARHGIPEQLCTDNVPFNSAEFLRFARDWSFTLVTSSPTYPQSNGQAEKTVQTLKQLLTKAMLSGRDPYIALLEYRNTPVCGMNLSPAQMLMSRRLRTKLPSIAKHLKPALVNAKPELAKQQLRQKHHYDRGANHLPPLKPGDSVHIREGKRWTPAVIVKKHHQPRSYIVSRNGVQYRRNRRQILHTPGIAAPMSQQRYYMDDEFDTPSAPNPPVPQVIVPPVHAPDSPVPQVAAPPVRAPITPIAEPHDIPNPERPPTDTVVTRTRSGRQRHTPKHFKDYVT